MQNGDRVTGSIIKKDAAQLTIKSAHFGILTLPSDQMESVKSDKPLTVVLPRDQSVEGTIASSGDRIVVASAARQETVPVKDIVVIGNGEEQKAYLRMLHPKLTELWGMTGIFGFARTTGNARTLTFTIPITFVRATRNAKITAHFNLIRSGLTATTATSR